MRADEATTFGDVRGAMTSEVATLSPDLSVAEAIVELGRRHVRGAPVVEHGRVVGVVTMHDLAADRPHPATTGPFLRPHAHETAWTVRDVMTSSPVVATPDEPLADAIVRMDELGVDRLPVVDDDGRPRGWLSSSDVVRAMARRIRRDRGTGVEPHARGSLLVPD